MDKLYNVLLSIGFEISENVSKSMRKYNSLVWLEIYDSCNGVPKRWNICLWSMETKEFLKLPWMSRLTRFVMGHAILNSLLFQCGAGIDFRRQNLTSKVDPRTERGCGT